MAKRQDGGIRLRPVGTRKHRQNAPAYSPAGTGCPAFEQAVENLYKGQNEESFWTLMGALNYALEMETHVLVPLRTALTVHNTPAPWTEHPVPTAKAKDLQLWTLRNEKGRTWLPMFTSAAAACADRSTSARPMADYTLQDAHYKSAAKLGHGAGYLYAHDYKNHYVRQQYLPDALKDSRFYEMTEIGYEKKMKEHLDKIKAEADSE